MKKVLLPKIQRGLQRFRQLPAVRNLRLRFPGLFLFLSNRFRTDRFTGLPLTLLLLAFAFNLVLLSQLTEDVLDSEGIVFLDKRFTALLFEIRSVWLSQTLYFFTHLGTRTATFILGGLLTVFLLMKKRFVAIVAFWLVMAGVGLSVQYGKKYISRDRPQDVGYYAETNYSFPSGHATTIMGLGGMIGYLFYVHTKLKWKRRTILNMAVATILLVGFSRIYLGVHYLSDVLAGYLLGGLWVLLGISLVEMAGFRRKKRRAAEVS